MKTSSQKAIALASLLLAAAANAQELFSVNLWNVGKGSPSVWYDADPAIQATNRATLTIENGETAGVWNTAAWQNMNISSVPAGGVTLNGSQSGTATFKIITKQNQSPYRWAVLRDGTSAVTPGINDVYMNNGNATLLDCRLFGTDNNTDAKIEVSGITLPLYDVIIYLSMSAEGGQYGSGASLGKGFIQFNSSIVNPGLTSWFVTPTPPTQTSTTLTEIIGDGGTGNYVHYKNVSGSSFTALVYGAGTNSAGIAGIQIHEVEATVGAVDPAVSTVAASPTLIPADGSTTSTVTVTLKDANGLPVSGKDVTLAGAPGDATIAPPTAVTTDVSGLATFTVSSSSPGTKVFTATDVTDSNLVIAQTASVNFAGSGNAGNSTVVASHASLVANGTTSTTVTVSLKDANSFAVQGKTITLAGSPGNAVITPASAVTNAAGVATFSVSSSTAGTEVFTATDTTDSVVIAQTVSVNFLDIATPLAIHFNVYNSAGTPVLDDPALLLGPAGGLGETWNQSNTTTASNLLSSTGALTGVNISCNANGRWTIGNPALKLLRAGAGQSDISQPMILTVSGLLPDRLFDVFLASARTDGVEPNTGTWSTTHETTSLVSQPVSNVGNLNGSTWANGNNYLVFRNVKVNVSGQLVFTGTSGANRLMLNGLQLVPVGKALITSFGIPGSAGIIDQNAKTISLPVPVGTDLATLAPTFTLNSGTCNQSSDSPPSPTFASANPATYVVTDTSTDPITVNTYTVTAVFPPPTTTLVIDLGNSPVGTTIAGSSYIGSGPTNLPLPALPPGSILRSISINTKLEATDNDNFASDFSLLIDPTPGAPGGDFSVEITNGTVPFGGTALNLDWPAAAEDGEGTLLVDTKTEANWSSLGNIDLATTGLFLGNAFGGPGNGGTWSGTITLTYDIVSGASSYETWAGSVPFDGDKNGDGVDNGLAFLLGAASPDENALGRLPKAHKSANGLVLTFSIRNAATRGPASAMVQWSNNLAPSDPWSANFAAVPESIGVINGVDFQITPNGTLNDVIATIPSTEAEAGKLFGRILGSEN